ncbi:MAG: Gfo/Idh/MocA family oxidoreductase [Crocinitomix sp.]|nr:Gfo/Idh/MocA family oxidoreductase [Crocinitomix sp.]
MIKEDQKVKFAIVGCGHIGKRHATMVQRNDESELIAMVDIRDKSELGMEAFEGVPFFNSIEDLINSGLKF